MFSQNPRMIVPDPASRNSAAGPKRDIIWDRPVFRPPLLPNPRVIFDPLPFTTQRMGATWRPASDRY